jgi:hypothetical protein
MLFMRMKLQTTREVTQLKIIKCATSLVWNLIMTTRGRESRESTVLITHLLHDDCWPLTAGPCDIYVLNPKHTASYLKCNTTNKQCIAILFAVKKSEELKPTIKATYVHSV